MTIKEEKALQPSTETELSKTYISYCNNLIKWGKSVSLETRTRARCHHIAEAFLRDGGAV